MIGTKNTDTCGWREGVKWGRIMVDFLEIWWRVLSESPGIIAVSCDPLDSHNSLR